MEHLLLAVNLTHERGRYPKYIANPQSFEPHRLIGIRWGEVARTISSNYDNYRAVLISVLCNGMLSYCW